MRPHLRLAILECDTLPPATRAHYGSYTGIYTALLHAGASSLSIPHSNLQITGWDVVEAGEYPGLENIDAVLISGAKYSAFASTPWIVRLVEFVKTILEGERGVRIVGVCFGHQIVGRAMGVKVVSSEHGWEASVCEVKLTEKGKEVFGRETLSIHQMHRDIVFDYPPGVEALSSSPKCQVQDMYIKGRLITVQGHPEFNQEIMTELLESRHERGIFDDALFDDGMARAGKGQDGVAVAKAFLRFLLEE